MERQTKEAPKQPINNKDQQDQVHTTILKVGDQVQITNKITTPYTNGQYKADLNDRRAIVTKVTVEHVYTYEHFDTISILGDFQRT